MELACHGRQLRRSRPAFEVASVKPNDNVGQPADFQLQPGGRVAITNLPLFQVIRAAYASDALQLDEQIVGPAWIKSERFDILAKAEGALRRTKRGCPNGSAPPLVQDAPPLERTPSKTSRGESTIQSERITETVRNSTTGAAHPYV
jgi:hypothetical protein